MKKKLLVLLVVSDKDLKKKKNLKRYNSYSFSFTKWNKMNRKKKLD